MCVSSSVARTHTANINLQKLSNWQTRSVLYTATLRHTSDHNWGSSHRLATHGDTNNKMIIPSALRTHNRERTCGNLYRGACSYLSESTLCNYRAIKPLRQCNDWLGRWHGAGNVTQAPRLSPHNKLQRFPRGLDLL